MNKLAIENRITLLENRPKENHQIVKKLRRQLRNLEKKENTKQND